MPIRYDLFGNMAFLYYEANETCWLFTSRNRGILRPPVSWSCFFLLAIGAYRHYIDCRILSRTVYRALCANGCCSLISPSPQSPPIKGVEIKKGSPIKVSRKLSGLSPCRRGLAQIIRELSHHAFRRRLYLSGFIPMKSGFLGGRNDREWARMQSLSEHTVCCYNNVG